MRVLLNQYFLKLIFRILHCREEIELFVGGKLEGSLGFPIPDNDCIYKSVPTTSIGVRASLGESWKRN